MRSWQHAQETLRATLGNSAYKAWIKPLRFAAFENGKILLDAPNKFYRDWLENNHLETVRKALTGDSGVAPEIVVRVAQGELFDEQDAEPPAERRERPKRREDAAEVAARLAKLVPGYTFENFIVGPSNQLAHAAAMSIARSPGSTYNPVFIYGSTGVGKTHLVNAIGHAIFQRSPSAKVVYLSCEAFVNELIISLRHKSMDEFKKRFRKVDVLIVDDVQFLAGRERTQEEFFHTFNTLHAARRQIVLTSDKTPKDIPDLEERLRNRFEWGLIADIQAPDKETTLAIVQQKAAALGVAIPPDVAAFLAENISSNVRELEGAIKRLAMKASLGKVEVTVEFAEAALEPLLHKERKQTTIEDVQTVICEHFGLTLTQLKSKRRTQNVVVPRQIAMFLARELLGASFPVIGEQFGGRDHSTVIHACSVIKARQDDDPALRATIERLARSISARRGH
ncbi:MAG TPA: chromosomal replication initiator protein DnaA [Dehalococcoidia bacterium]|nr:chromosomal replication initiator protein DnaA [Dehalococcoidia bacterium]